MKTKQGVDTACGIVPGMLTKHKCLFLSPSFPIETVVLSPIPGLEQVLMTCAL